MEIPVTKMYGTFIIIWFEIVPFISCAIMDNISVMWSNTAVFWCSVCLQASSTYVVTAAPVDPKARPSSVASFHPPIGNSYGNYSGTVPGSAATFTTGLHTAGNRMRQQAPSSVPRFQSPTGNQHGTHSGYPSALNQYQMPSGYPSNPNQYQFHGSYQSTPLPGYGQSTYRSHGNPSTYNTIPYEPEMQQCVQAPMTSRNPYQAPGSAEAYRAPGYAAANLIGRPHQVPPPTLPAYSSQPVAQWVPNRGSSSSWSSDSYRPYGPQTGRWSSIRIC